MLRVLLIISYLIAKVTSKNTDTSQQYQMCKLTRNGIEYIGKISKTETGQECELWESSHMASDNVLDQLTDDFFPDGKKNLARNFCRNPNNATFGPWCYTKIEESKKENCTIPICSNKENCRVTGPGMEYSGSVQKSAYDNECQQWSVAGEHENIDKMLPEGDVMMAGKACRNPNGLNAGPWCYVIMEDIMDTLMKEANLTFVQEICNIPICFNQPSISVIENVERSNEENYYTHFSSLKSETEEITFSVKLWNPEDWRTGEIRIALSSLAVPATGKQLREWDIGYELIIRNSRSEITRKDNEDESSTNQPGMISGIRWSNFKITWNNGFVSLSDESKENPYLILELKEQENGILSQKRSQINYISVLGVQSFWNFTQVETTCDEQVTTSYRMTRYKILSSDLLSKQFNFHLRCAGNATIVLRITPTLVYPSVRIFFDNDSDKVNLIMKTNLTDEKIFKTISLKPFLSYWKWSQFAITISGERLHMTIKKKTTSETLFDTYNIVFQAVEWYGVASSSTAHWTFYCNPLIQEYEATPPECSVSEKDIEYEGHQWVTLTGRPCLPWVAINDLEDKQFVDETIAAALNYCRNPTMDEQGTFCFVIDFSNKREIMKEYCDIRKCKFKDCRIAGTANDFMGQITKTITGRECQDWNKNQPHKVDKDLLRDELFPERSINNAKNNCRDPSKNVAGPWCYTLDPKVDIDLCYVPDCHKATECTVIIRTAASKRVFLTPEWRAQGFPFWVKMWNPNISTALVLNWFQDEESSAKYQMILGDEDNEKIKLLYSDGSGSEVLLKEKTITHILSSGRWIGVTARFLTDQITLTYEGVRNPFFIWTKDEKLPLESPMFFSYEARSEEDKGSIGLSFPCEICQTEICLKEFNHYSVYYPMSIWVNNGSMPVDNITFHVRGSGVFTVNLYRLPSKHPDGILLIDHGSTGDIVEVQMVGRKYLNRVASKLGQGPVISKDGWLKVTLTFDDPNGSLVLNGSKYLEWQYPRVPLFYYFSVKCTYKITWVVNCDPPQLDGPTKNGGWSQWSEWECSVTCDGGTGKRHRICNNPKPSMFGQTCVGPSTEVGICNDFICGEITTLTINIIRRNLAISATNIEINIHEQLQILCNPKMLQLIKEDSLKAEIYWSKDGIKISEHYEMRNIDTANFHILIKSANLQDTGMYVCVAVKVGGESEIIDVISLIVKSMTYTHRLRIGNRLVLKANTIALANVFANIRLTWFHNNNVYKEYDITDLSLIDMDVIEHVKQEDAGEWWSVVYQDQLGLNWTTSWYSVIVLRKANLAIHLLETDLFKGTFGTNEYIVYTVYIVMLVIVLAISIAFVIFIIRLQAYFKKYQNRK